MCEKRIEIRAKVKRKREREWYGGGEAKEEDQERKEKEREGRRTEGGRENEFLFDWHVLRPDSLEAPTKDFQDKEKSKNILWVRKKIRNRGERKREGEKVEGGIEAKRHSSLVDTVDMISD